jgi:ADP-heptose:LPS heptosyltransferase
MDKKNNYIDFEHSIFFDPKPTERALNINDITNLKKLITLEPEKAYAMPYEIDFFTFLILNLIPAKSKHGFIASRQSLLRNFLLTLIFPKIYFDTLSIDRVNSRIQAHSETFFRIGGKQFNFKGYNSPVFPQQYAVISPFASSKEREYPYTKFKEISTQLYQVYGIRSIYLGQSDLIEQDNEAISFEYNIPIDLLFNRIQNCAVFIGNDSGLSHIALRYNKKTVVLFSRMEQYGLYFPYNNAIMICNKNISEIDTDEIVQKSMQ